MFALAGCAPGEDWEPGGAAPLLAAMFIMLCMASGDMLDIMLLAVCNISGDMCIPAISNSTDNVSC